MVHAHALWDRNTVRYLPDNSVNIVRCEEATTFFFEVHDVVASYLVFRTEISWLFGRNDVAFRDIHLTLESFTLHCTFLIVRYFLGDLNALFLFYSD